MAKGWESKSVEEQQTAIQTPVSAEDRERLSRERAERLRQVQALNLSRARVLQQLERTENERYTQMLKAELAVLDDQLKKFSE